MPRILFVLICFALAQCASPGPGPEQTDQDTGARRLRQIVYPGDDASTILFTYDGNGDITLVMNSSDSAVYRYTGDSVFIEWRDGNRSVVSSQRYSTSPEGRVLTNAIMDPGGEVFSTCTYAYNAKGQITRQERITPRTSDTFSLSFGYNGDDMTEMIVRRNGEVADGFYYVYDTTRLNRFNIDVNNTVNDFFANDRTGVLNKHLMREFFRITPEGDTTSHVAYTYQLDSAGYVVSRTDVDVQYGYSTERRFIYSE